MGFAPTYTRVAASQTASQIASGNTVKIYGLVVQSTANPGTVTLLTGDGNTTIATLTVAQNTGYPVEIEWVADNGLSVTTTANTTCTVFHGQAGA